ncbi:toxin glutamine deamidase domain-containing protein [Actinoplanes sp. NPDC004185]
MTILPSPIPHPLDYMPFDVPGWAYEALEWVVGFDWPEGNEKTTWDVADRWYALAQRLAEPRDEAYDAAGQVLSGYGGAGAQAFKGAWDQLSADENAPLNSLLAIADELGKLVEECGCDIEGAKLEAWIEIGLFLIELIGMAVAVALTLGAASPAAGGLIAATRLAIQQIFKRLIQQLSKKAIKKTLKEAGQRAAKQLTTKAGLKKLGKEAFKEGFDEMREEIATNGAIQAYQNSTGRAHGFDVRDLGMSAAGGFAGGFAASGAGIGKGGHGGGGMTRGMAAEVLGEFGGAAVSGDLPDLESVAKSASSGASGSLMDGGRSGFADGLADKVGNLGVPSGPVDLASGSATGDGGTDGPLSSAFSPISSSGGASSGDASSTASSSNGASSAGDSSAGHSSAGSSGSGATFAPLSVSSDPTASASGSSPVSVSADATSVSYSAPAPSGGVNLSSLAPVVDAPSSPGGDVGASPGGAGGSGAPGGTAGSGTPAAFAGSGPPGGLGSPAPTGYSGGGAGSLSTGAVTSGSGPSVSSAPSGPASPAGGSTGSLSGNGPSVSSVPRSATPAGGLSPWSPFGTDTSSNGTTPPARSPGIDRPNLTPASSPLTGNSPLGNGNHPTPAGISPTITSPGGTGPNVTSPGSTGPGGTGPSVAGPGGTGPSVTPPRTSPDGSTPAGTDPNSTSPRNPASPVGVARGTATVDVSAPAASSTGTGVLPGRTDPGVPAPSSPATRPPQVPGPRDGAVDVPSRLSTTPTDPAAVLVGAAPGRSLPPQPAAAPVETEVDGYFRYARELRESYATHRRQEVIDAVEGKADSARRRARSARRSARVARFLKFDPHLAAYFQAHVDVATAEAERAEAQAAALKNPAWRPPPGTITDVAPQHWHRANEDRGRVARGAVTFGNRSMLTGNDHPPPIDATRPYGTRAGLREPLAQHQVDLESAVPRDGNGDPVRGADPRAPYFQLVNDGGSKADPTRGINCQDCVLSFFDTYVHGRPRVSAPRTFDGYADGDSTKPLYGEDTGPERVEHATGGRFQSLCAGVGGDHPAVAGQKIQQALGDVSAQLLAGGHGSFAFLVNAWEGGSAHAWAAVNQNGQILFVDPQSGLVAPPGTSLYGHLGRPDTANVVALDALVVDGRGNPMPFNGRPDGLWRPRQTTLPPPPPRPAPVYYSSAYQQQPAPSPAPGPFPSPSPTPGPTPSPTPRPAPSPAPSPAPPPSPVPPPSPAPSPFPTPAPAPSPAPDLSPGPDLPPAPSPGPGPDPSPWSAVTTAPGPSPAPDLAPSPNPDQATPPAPAPDPVPAPRLLATPAPSPAPDLVEPTPAPRDETPDALLADDLGRVSQAEPVTPFDPRPEPDPRPGPTPSTPEPSVTPRPAPNPIPSPRRPVDRIAEALAPRPAPVDRIAEALAPRDDRPPTLDRTPNSTDPNSTDPNSPIDEALHSGTPDQTAGIDPERAERLEQVRLAEQDARERKSYREYMEHARATQEDNRRAEYADYLVRIADGQRTKVLDLGMQADAALASGSTLRGEHLRAEARRTSEDADDLELKARQVLAGEFAPERVEVEPADWVRINDDVGTMALGGVETGDQSALTGDGHPLPVDQSRPYGKRGGLRAPLAVHQVDLENAMPRDADGRVVRTADPRQGKWFGLANDGGPAADPTRGINCVDGVLSLYETYVHGRPRVSAPRTFDSYAYGDPARPLGAEDRGLARIEDTVGGEFQGLCPYVGGLDPQQAKQAVDTAMTNLHNHLYNAGHGAFAFIVTDSEEGTAHAWAAVNQNGTILFLDPQTGRLSEEAPLYSHTGAKNDGNVISMDAVVVDGLGRPAPLPYHEAGLWSRSSLEPTGATPADPADDGQASRVGPQGADPDGHTPQRPVHEQSDATEVGPLTDLDEDDVRLSGDPAIRPLRNGDEPGRLPGAAGQSVPSGDLERPAESLDQRTGAGGADPVRRQVPGTPATGESARGGTDRSGDPSDGTPERANAPSDVQGGRTDGLDPRPASPVAPGDESLTSTSGTQPRRIPVSEMVAEDFDPREAERRQLAALEPDHREIIEKSVDHAMKDAARLQVTLEEVVASINDAFGDGAAQLVGVENSYKTKSSLARAFAAEFEAEETPPGQFLKDTKDRVRFSIQLHEQDYHLHAAAAIADLGSRGHNIRKIVNFWGGGGRHNGLNVTVTDPTGVVFELQFPTEASRAVSELTHELYEVLRHNFAPYPARVDAFLRILAINIREGIDEKQPSGIDALRDMRLGVWKDVDSTFGTWIRSTDTQWNKYLGDLRAEGSTFDRILERNGLTLAEVFESDGSDEDDRHGVRLSGNPEVRHVGRSDEPGRLRGAELPRIASSDVERAAESVDLRSRDSGDIPVRPELPRENPATESNRSRASRPGNPQGGVADGADAPGDARRGPEDGLGLRSAAPVADPRPLPESPAGPVPQASGPGRSQDDPTDDDSAAEPRESGTDRLGGPAVETSEGTDASGDVPGERSDEPDLTSETPVSGESLPTNAGPVVINGLVGQLQGALGDDFAIGAHYLELFEYEHERRQAERLGQSFDVRALEAAHGRSDGLGNPDVLLRTDSTDVGSYGDLKRLDPDLKADRKDADFSRRVEKRLREPFGQDPRITVAVVDGRDVGLTIDAAVRGIRRALGFWRQQGREVRPEQRMIVFTGDGGSVVWRGDTGGINVSA